MGTQMGQEMGQAGEAMGQAQKSLNGQDLGNAGNAQEQALEALRKGAEALAKQMQNGPTAPARARKIRSAAARSASANNIKLPDANDLARARDILQELRRRAGERGRPPAGAGLYRPAAKEF